jgi:hypothetical protein
MSPDTVSDIEPEGVRNAKIQLRKGTGELPACRSCRHIRTDLDGPAKLISEWMDRSLEHGPSPT